MAVHSGLLRMQTQGDGEIVDLTDGVRAVLRTSGVQLGVVTVFATGRRWRSPRWSTSPAAWVTCAPCSSGSCRRARPPAEYAHNRLNGDTNAHAHLRAAIIGPSRIDPRVGRRARAGNLAAGGPARLRRPPAPADGDRPRRLVGPARTGPRARGGRAAALRCRRPAALGAGSGRATGPPRSPRSQCERYTGGPVRMAPMGAGPVSASS